MSVLVLLCLETREVIVSAATEHPNSAWVVRQGEAFVDQTANRDTKPDIIMHDRDTKFTKQLTAKLKDHGLRMNVLPKASPNLNGRCERFIQTIKLECLAKFIIFGKTHLDHLLCEFTDYYNTVRSHMERDHLPPRGDVPEEVETLDRDQIAIQSHVGGLVKSFERKAA
jgi:putative transposase